MMLKKLTVNHEHIYYFISLLNLIETGVLEASL